MGKQKAANFSKKLSQKKTAQQWGGVK